MILSISHIMRIWVLSKLLDSDINGKIEKFNVIAGNPATQP